MNRFLFKWRKIVNRLHLMLFVKQYKNDRYVIVCHVLRYTVFYQKLKELLDGGTVGEIVFVQVGFWHQAHSFVRGNWREWSVELLEVHFDPVKG